MMELDWTKPIETTRGERCVFLEKYLPGWVLVAIKEGGSEWFLRQVNAFELRNVSTPTLRPYTRAELIELVGQSIVHKGTGCRWNVVYLHIGTDHSQCWLRCGDDFNELSVSREGLLAGWTHTDGSPCGVKEG